MKGTSAGSARDAERILQRFAMMFVLIVCASVSILGPLACT